MLMLVLCCTGTSRPVSVSGQGSGKFHHGYGYDPNSDGWKVDCSSGTQKSFSTYTVAKPEVWAPLLHFTPFTSNIVRLAVILRCCWQMSEAVEDVTSFRMCPVLPGSAMFQNLVMCLKSRA